MAEIEINQTAPKFKLPADQNRSLSSDQFLDKTLVLYFYPKDDTSGCTSQAQQFSEAIDSFTAIGAVVVGVSKDSVKSHDKFIAKYGLKIPLLSDENLELANAYGVWVEKSMYGRKYMGIERSTFLIDKNGKIARVWRKVKIPGHINEVLEAAKQIAP
jgi:thioredoxin-dependent peroxiredoxin